MKRYQFFMLFLTVLFICAPACKKHTKREKQLAYNADSLFMPELPPPVLELPAAESLLATNDTLLNLPSMPEATASQRASSYDANNPDELDFEVHNRTGKTVYVTSFVYQRKRDFGNWRWDNSPVYTIDSGKILTIDIDTIPDEQDRNNVFGYLGVFNTEQEAHDATYELTKDQNLLDLDLVYKLKGKRVTLEIEKYGYKEFFDYDFVKKDTEKKSHPELDFAVENKTGKPIIVTCFVYEKKAKGRWVPTLEEKDDMTVWRFDKTPLLRLMPDETGIIDVDTITSQYDRSYLRGYLAVFDMDEEDLAQRATYELLETKHKLHIGEPLAKLTHKTIVINVEKYGVAEDFIDFTIKPRHPIDFTKIK